MSRWEPSLAVCVHKNHAYHIAVTQHFASHLSNTGAFVWLTRSNPETKAVVQPEGYETLPDIHVHTYTLVRGIYGHYHVL